MNAVIYYNTIIVVITSLSIMSFLLATKMKLWQNHPASYSFLGGMFLIVISRLVHPDSEYWIEYHLTILAIVQCIIITFLIINVRDMLIKRRRKTDA